MIHPRRLAWVLGLATLALPVADAAGAAGGGAQPGAPWWIQYPVGFALVATMAWTIKHYTGLEERRMEAFLGELKALREAGATSDKEIVGAIQAGNRELAHGIAAMSERVSVLLATSAALTASAAAAATSGIDIRALQEIAEGAVEKVLRRDRPGT